MKKWILFGLALLLLAVPLSACSTYIHFAIPLPITEPGYESDEVAIAVDFFGVKHIARLECPIVGSDPCKLVYTQVKPGLPGLSVTAYSWLPAAGSGLIDDIDIAVTDSGTAYILYRWYPMYSSTYELYFMRSDNLGVPYTIEDTYKVNGDVHAVARGNVVYAVYGADDGTRHYIRYKRLTGAAINGWVVHTPDTDYALHDASVGWNGWLYIVYYHMLELRYSDNYGMSAGGNLTKDYFISSYSNDTPDIDVNGSPETVYIIYAKGHSGTDDELFIAHCPAASCTSLTNVAIPFTSSGLNWDISGDPQIIGDVGTMSYYIFTASNSSTYNDDAYAGIFQVGVTPGAPLPGTFTPENEIDARICLMYSVSPVYTWRMDQGGGYYGNIIEFDWVVFATRLVRATTTGRAESDFACNADWGAGIWNEESPIDKQAWVSFNTYPALLPMIRK